MTRHVVVVGAGIVGVSSAIWLQRAGAQVTIIDRAAPGTGTSHGNAGVLAACAVAPVTAPGLIAKAPAMLLNPDVPLYLRLPYLPRLLPWLAKYLRVANDRDTRRIAQGLALVTCVANHQSHSCLCAHHFKLLGSDLKPALGGGGLRQRYREDQHGYGG